MSRTRTRDRSRKAIGSRTYNGVYHYTRDYDVLDTEVCIDHIGKPPYVNPQDFHLEKYLSFVPTINGTLTYGDNHVYEYNGYPVLTGEVLGFGTSFLTPDSAYITEALARENPSTPEVDLALSLIELKDMPRLIRDIHRLGEGLGQKYFDSMMNASFVSAWRTHTRKVREGKESSFTNTVSRTYLAYQFGLAPLIDDMMKIMDIARSTAHRVRRARRLERGDSVGGTLEKVHKRGKHYWNATFTVGDVIRVEAVSNYHRKVWYTFHASGGSVKVPRGLSRMASSPKLNRFGPDQPLATVWNLIPWSFLVDYFVNLNSFLRATEGKYSFTPSYVCLMKHTKIEYEATRVYLAPVGAAAVSRESPDLYLGRTKGKREWKSRTIHFDPKPSISVLPLVSPRQQTNIAALLGSRGR